MAGSIAHGSARENHASTEWAVRVQLAACYRLLAHFRMTDHIYTHVSAAVPGPDRHFLINPFGLRFEEITASSLVKIDLEGKPMAPMPSDVNPAGFTIHSAVHAARPDVHCVVHTHTRAGMAIAALREGLLPISQIALQFYDRLAYHDYEGIALDLDERERLTRDLGEKPAMILRNHGLLTAGRSVPHAFSMMYYLDKACEIQLAALATGREPIVPAPETCEYTARQFETERGTPRDSITESPGMEREWQAFLRLLEREQPDYRH